MTAYPIRYRRSFKHCAGSLDHLRRDVIAASPTRRPKQPYNHTHASDSDGHFEDNDALELDVNLSSITNSTLKYLNYSDEYIPNWGLDEAFRELYQNW